MNLEYNLSLCKDKMKNSKNLGLLSLLLLTLCGCFSKWPPIVDNNRDIMSLNSTTRSVRARGLSDKDIPSLKHLPNLVYLDFSGGWAVEKAKISDAGLKSLSDVPFTRLKTLSLGYCDQITDAGLCHLVRMKTIKWLSLSSCPNITNKGLSNLTSMSTLETLDLRGCPKISDEGLVYIAKMTNLHQVLLGGCENVSSSAVEKLQKTINCRVEKDDKEWSYHIKN